jgi:hypothetical protein
MISKNVWELAAEDLNGKKTISIKTPDLVCVCQKIIIICIKKNINQDQKSML